MDKCHTSYDDAQTAQRNHAGRCLVTTAEMESWRIALLPKYFRNGITLLLAKKSSKTSLNHCYRKLHFANHYVKACESLRRQLQLLAALHRHRQFLCGKRFVPVINVTSVHVIGWVLPLCREIWFQMRWSNFEKNMHSFASFLGEFFTTFWILTGFSSFLLEPVYSSESECND